MSTIRAIITHPGSAHKDEFLACSVLLARFPVPILRREPSPEDLQDASLCVVDVGQQHEPSLNNFDHHQFPREQTPTCSLSLVLKHFGLYEEARSFCEWLEVAEWFDCRGPVSTAQWLGVEREIVNKLSSPIDGSLLRRFAKSGQLEPGQPVWELMKMVGEDLLSFLKTMHDRLEFISANSELWTVDAGGRSAKVLFLPRTNPLPEDPSFAIERYVEKIGLSSEIVGTIYPDSRGSGYGLSRFRDHPCFNFLRVAQSKDVHFTHARGFLAKTSSTDVAYLKELLLAAVEPKE